MTFPTKKDILVRTYETCWHRLCAATDASFFAEATSLWLCIEYYTAADRDIEHFSNLEHNVASHKSTTIDIYWWSSCDNELVLTSTSLLYSIHKHNVLG